MLASDVLDEAGLPYALVSFNSPPEGSYAVYSEEIARRGADAFNCITECAVTIEVYSCDFFDSEAVEAVTRVLERSGLSYTKYDTTFIEKEHLYCTPIEYSFTAKDGVLERMLHII